MAFTVRFYYTIDIEPIQDIVHGVKMELVVPAFIGILVKCLGILNIVRNIDTSGDSPENTRRRQGGGSCRRLRDLEAPRLRLLGLLSFP